MSDGIPFEVGAIYTRRQVFAHLGGDLVSILPTYRGQVLYCCIPHYSHPDAPEVILVSAQKRMLAAAKQLAKQLEAIPIFLRQGREANSDLIYQGDFTVARYSDNREEVRAFAKKAHRQDIVGIIFMQRVR